MDKLIDVTEVARNGTGAIPDWRVSITSAVWDRCVTVPKGIDGQSEDSRLHDLLAFVEYYLKQAPATEFGVLSGGFGFSAVVRNDNRNRSELPDGIECPGDPVPLAVFATIGEGGVPGLLVLARSEAPDMF